MTKPIKPPLGLIPKEMVMEERFKDVFGAISRYWNANLPIPIEWVEEYNELVVILKDKL